jgi:predicted ATPase
LVEIIGRNSFKQAFMIHLRQISLDNHFPKKDAYPNNIRVLEKFSQLSFLTPITIFVGENGSGKSTLIEAIAKAVGSIAIGSEEVSKDRSITHVQPLADALHLIWNERTHRGFFLRAEDFFGFIRAQREMKNNINSDIDEIKKNFNDRSDYSKSLALGPSISSINAMKRWYGNDLDANSHGESFLVLFQSRFVPGGLFLLDEPEAALSPVSQLGLITMIKQMVSEDAQFIIATHSPILMALDEAMLYDFDQSPPAQVDYESLESVTLYRQFLTDPKAFLRHL